MLSTSLSSAARVLLVAGGLSALTGCGMSNPRLVHVKSPEATPCQAADCPTLEIPAPNHDEQFNPAASGAITFDGSPVKRPLVFATSGRLWYVMKINAGPHSVKVEPAEGTNLVGAIAGAAEDALRFEAKKGKRYWLFNRIGVGGYSSKTWVEEADGGRAVVAGERNLEPHHLTAALFLGEGEKKAQASQVEVWWSAAPAADKLFQSPSTQQVGELPGAR